jgi:hypothetical protein
MILTASLDGNTLCTHALLAQLHCNNLLLCFSLLLSAAQTLASKRILSSPVVQAPDATAQVGQIFTPVTSAQLK